MAAKSCFRAQDNVKEALFENSHTLKGSTHSQATCVFCDVKTGLRNSESCSSKAEHMRHTIRRGIRNVTLRLWN